MNESKFYLVNLIVEVPVKADSVEEAREIAKWALKQELKDGHEFDPQVDSLIETTLEEAPLAFYTGEMLTMNLYTEKKE